jgi:hypothetical protein
MSENRRRILDLLAAGKITADEAEQLVSALPESTQPSAPNGGPTPGPSGKYLRIEVLKPAHDGVREKKVNIRVPVAVLRSGLKLGSLMRGFKHDQGDEPWSRHFKVGGMAVDLDHFDAAQLDELLSAAGDVTIDVDEGRAKIRVVRE